MRLIVLLITAFCCSCELKYKAENGVPGLTEIPCDNLDKLDLKEYPKPIDSLINNRLVREYKIDSLINYRILGNVYYTISLINCKIDSSSYNASVEVKTAKKKEYWLFSFKKKGNSMKVISFYKSPLKKGGIPKQY